MRLKPEQADIHIRIVRAYQLVAVVLRVTIRRTVDYPPPSTSTFTYSAKGVAIQSRSDNHSAATGLRVAVAHALKQMFANRELRSVVWRVVQQELRSPTYCVTGTNVLHERVALLTVREEVKS